MLRDLLRLDGERVGRKHVSTLMKKMGIEALYRKPNSSQKHPGHKIHPYLLTGLEINRPNQVWAMDITYIPMARGFVYLTVVVDWYSRKILCWQLSNTMALSASRRLIRLSHGMVPSISSTPTRGANLAVRPSAANSRRTTSASVWIKGSWRDNVFVERLWHAIKYEEVYLKAYESVTEARQSISNDIPFYNQRWPHSIFDGVPR